MTTPTVLNQRYQLQRLLSHKGPRKTFLAQDLTTEESVVVKVLNFGPDLKWEDHKLFERGAIALKELSHPRIPRYIDYFNVDIEGIRGFGQVQSYIPARSLQDYLQSGRTFSEAELKQIAQDLLEILSYLHSRQPAVVHRDLKPSNILLGDRSGNQVGEVYLVDFDSVQTQATQNPEQTMTIVGTYGFMAPEQFIGRACPASDLYGLGATLIAIATGKSLADLPQKNGRADFEPFTHLSLDLTNWLKWMTEPDLRLRLDSAWKALDALASPSVQPPHLQAAGALPTQPREDRISLKQEGDTLHLRVTAVELGNQNPIALGWNLILAVIGAIPLLAACIMLILGISALFSSAGAVGFFLFGTLMLLIVGGAMTLPLLTRIVGETHLKITPNNLIGYTSLARIPMEQQRLPRQDLKHICVGQERGSRHQVLLLKAWYVTFKIPLHDVAEMDWLAAELSQYLKIPVQPLEESR